MTRDIVAGGRLLAISAAAALLFGLAARARGAGPAAEPAAVGPEPGLYGGDASKGEIELLEEALVFENKWVRFYNDKVRFPNGREGTYNRVSRPALARGRISGSAVLALTADGKVLLEEVFRHPIRGWTFELPRGGFEAGETLTETGQRELLEETGYRCKEWSELGLLYPDTGLTDYAVQLLLARGCAYAEAPTERMEALRLSIRPWSEVLRMAQGGEIKDSMTLSALLRAGPPR